MTLHPQYITDTKGKKKAVVLPIKEYNQLLEELEELQDVKLYDAIKAVNEPSIPFESYLKKRKARK